MPEQTIKLVTTEFRALTQDFNQWQFIFSMREGGALESGENDLAELYAAAEVGLLDAETALLALVAHPDYHV